MSAFVTLNTKQKFALLTVIREAIKSKIKLSKSVVEGIESVRDQIKSEFNS